QLRRTFGGRSCCAWARCDVRTGKRSGCRRASRRSSLRGDICSIRQRARLRLSEGKSRTRRSGGRKRCDYFGVSTRHTAVTAKLSDSQPDHCRHGSWSYRRRSGRIFRFTHHRASRSRVRPRNFCCAGQHYVSPELWSTCVDPARSKARRKLAGYVEASKFTEVGYVGRDVESMIRDLVEISIDMVRNEKLEEVTDKA